MIISRREAIFLGGVAAADLYLSNVAEAAGDTIVFIGAKDCAICRSFEAYQKEGFVAKVKAAGMTFREVKVTSLRNVLEVAPWPKDLQWLRATMSINDGTPWFYRISGHKILKYTQTPDNAI